jgi:DNA-binding transcriptional regulator WhiA
MSKGFKLLRGRTILLSVPERKKSALELSAKDEEAMMQEAAKLWSKLTVYAIGDKVEDVKEGDVVYVRTGALNMEHMERIEIDGAIKLVLNEGDVVIVW